MIGGGNDPVKGMRIADVVIEAASRRAGVGSVLGREKDDNDDNYGRRSRIDRFQKCHFGSAEDYYMSERIECLDSSDLIDYFFFITHITSHGH